jgi:hypothetical protein
MSEADEIKEEIGYLKSIVSLIVALIVFHLTIKKHIKALKAL